MRFFLWGFVKDIDFVPPVPVNLQELRDRITTAMALIDRDILTHVWNELDYRLDVCLSAKVDTLSIVMYEEKNYIDPLYSLFINKF